MTTANPLQTEVRRNPLWKRRLASASRWLHIYLSMVSFTILLFFAVTGYTLNHADALTANPQTIKYTGLITPRFLKEPDKLAIVEQLRSRHSIKGAMSEFRIDDSQLTVAFRGPGYSADAIIDRSNGSYSLTEVRSGVIAVMNDLHKGRDTGPGWSLMIDISAILMTVVSLSGLTLIFFLPKRRPSGLILAAAGTALCFLIYRIFVP